MKKYLIILFALFIAAGCSNNDSSDSNTATPIKTTVLMYIEGTTYEYPKVANIFFDEYTSEGIKTDALGYGPANYMIKGMIKNLNPDNTNIVIQTGSKEPNMTWTDAEIAAADADPEKFYIKDWYKANRWQITKEGLKLLETKGDVCRDENNTNNPNCVDIVSGDTIGEFLTYGVQKYPADRYIVIFFSHGGGSIQGFGSGVTLSEMQKAFSMAKTKTNAEFDIIGFAACLMGNAEWMHGLSDYGKYYVASEESEPGFPWLLGDITSGIAQNQTTEQLLDTITSTFYQYSAKNGKQATNISAVDLKQVKALSGALGQLSKKIAEDYQTNPAKTFNNFYVALSRANSYAEGAFGLYDLQAVINSLNETKWYGLDYSSYNQQITDNISNSVKINKTSPFLSESNGISFYAPNIGQSYFECFMPSFRCLVNLYSNTISNFSDEYISMLDNITEYGDNTETFIDVSTIRKDGTKYSIDYTSNFAPSYNSTLELIRTYDDGATRIGTVEGDYMITAVPDENPDNYKYTITVDTGYEQTIDANLFAIAPYGTTDYSPIRVVIKKSIDNFNATNTVAKTLLLLTREGETPNKKLLATFRYSKEDGKYIIHDTTFSDQDNKDELAMPFSFQAGDEITIPDYSSVTGRAETNANLPSYTITCSSEKCVEFNIVPFEASETPKFRFNINNVKNDNPYLTAEQTTFN